MANDRPIRAAVIGAGYLGRFHAQKYAAIEGVELRWVVDADPARAREVAQETGARASSDYREVLGDVEAVSIATPTRLHFAIARDCLEAGLDVLVEKPITETVAEADELVARAAKDHRVLMAGHLERFNPAVQALAATVVRPAFIVAERLGPFKERAANIDVILDLMIHDLDIVLHLVSSPVERISAIGVPVLSDKIDLANARLEFQNGAVATLTASRVSLGEPIRKIRVFQTDSYISIDYQKQKMAVFTIGDGESADPMSRIKIEEVQLDRQDNLELEIRSFLSCVRDRSRPLVSGEEGRRALAAALDIIACIQRSRPEGAI